MSCIYEGASSCTGGTASGHEHRLHGTRLFLMYLDLDELPDALPHPLVLVDAKRLALAPGSAAADYLGDPAQPAGRVRCGTESRSELGRAAARAPCACSRTCATSATSSTRSPSTTASARQRPTRRRIRARRNHQHALGRAPRVRRPRRLAATTVSPRRSTSRRSCDMDYTYDWTLPDPGSRPPRSHGEPPRGRPRTSTRRS